MSIPDKKIPYKSLIHHEYSLDILKFVSEGKNPINFSSIMEKLGISKRALYLTLKDLEKEELITQTKLGRKTIITISEKGINALSSINNNNNNNSGQLNYEFVINSTIKQLESEGIISKDWSVEEREEFIKKIKNSIISNL